MSGKMESKLGKFLEEKGFTNQEIIGILGNIVEEDDIYSMRQLFAMWLRVKGYKLRYPLSSAPIWFTREVKSKYEWYV